ncbi:MAG TPA: tyrosine--tRNA ligase [Planctomycetaceae bacterium]|nr:tyrosine--tRNA ligase [Planctomycetaceae bacterium]
MSQFPPVAEQLAVIRRGVEKIVPESELAERLEQSRKTGKPLRVKYGIDPTGIDVHLGHTVPLRKIRQFQELGHQAVIIIGNYTALVGDPSGRDETRARLTQAQVEANARDYLTQVGKVVDLSRAEVIPNGQWFSTMSFLDVLELCGKVTVAQLLTRDDFSKRYQSEQPIFLHECLYPVMQAWDSVKIKADVELGGTEQLYSFMLARDLQRDAGLAQQIGVMTPILVGLDGERRMGKSLGNYIGISESPYEMMKKFMQLPDAVMPMYFELLTDMPLDDVHRLLGGHPKEAKIALAKAVIGEYHHSGAAENAASEWQRVIGGKGMPEGITTASISRSKLADGQVQAARLIVLAGLCSTTSDARRAIAQGGAYLGENKERIDNYNALIAVETGLLLWVGKKRVVRLELVP